MDNALQFVPYLLGVGAFICLIFWRSIRSYSVLEKWANQHGFKILHSELRYLFKGPFFWTTSRGQIVYHVHVRDSHGRERSGWLRCGGWFLGLLSDHTEVRWED